MIFVIDNYDSFTYNLVHMLRAQCTKYGGDGGTEVIVRRNDAFDLDEVAAATAIVISPGPRVPADAGQTLAVIDRYKTTKRILGICLGHQAIIEAFGGRLKNLDTVLHGVARTTRIARHDSLFEGLGDTIRVGHYHSWVADSLPDVLEATAYDYSDHKNGFVNAVRHRALDIHGVQFHPESILTPDGARILRNWLDNTG